MKLYINDEIKHIRCTTLAELLDVLDYKGSAFATAIDGVFVPRQQRGAVALSDGMKIEIVSPMQGG